MVYYSCHFLLHSRGKPTKNVKFIGLILQPYLIALHTTAHRYAMDTDAFKKLSEQISKLGERQDDRFKDMKSLLQANERSIGENCKRIDDVEDFVVEQQRRTRKE